MTATATPSAISSPVKRVLPFAFNILSLAFLLYLFLFAIALFGAAFKLVGEDFSRQLIATTAHPVMGLMIGLLSTAIIQSSSTTSSIVVGMVAGGALTVRGAIPIIMGANLGTTITCTLVAMAALSRRAEFQRSFAAATMHDFFNLLTILILFPLEQATHVLEKVATWLSARFVGAHNPEFANPIKEIVEPLVDGAAAVLTGNLKPGLAAAVMIVLALAGIFLALLFLTRLLKRVVLSRAEGAFAKHLRGNEGVAMLMGLVITAVIQSSSVTTSMLVPLVGAGIVPLGSAFATALGANVGTTVTAMLASLTGTADAVTVAFVHLLFNVGGVLIFYPVPAIRRIPTGLAQALARVAARRRILALVYVVGVFFLLPMMFLLVDKMMRGL